MSIHRSGEDYLEAILVLREKNGTCRSIDVVNYMGFSKPSVSIGMAKLEESGCIIKQPDGELHLTEKGLEIARKTLEKHRFITELFIAIGVTPETAEQDACSIEHSLSEESYERLREWHKKLTEERRQIYGR